MASLRSVFNGARRVSLSLSCSERSSLEWRSSMNLNLMGFRSCCAGRRGFSQLLNAFPATAICSPRFLRSTGYSQFPSSCFSQVRTVHNKSDVEMAEFLKQEIQTEKESIKDTGKAVQVKGFDVQTNEADITLKKKFQDEEILVKLNVNHSVDAEEGENEAKPDLTKMVCKPDFQVNISKRGYTLTVNCSMLRRDDEEESEDPSERSPRDSADGGAYQDLFAIDELTIHKGEVKANTYVMAGDVMDGDFYDHLMNMLDERGINNTFVQQVTDLSTLYEEKLYVNLLEHLQDIVGKAK